MDDQKAILNLSTYFPKKSEDYLRKLYRKHHCDIEATIKAIHNDESQNKNCIARFFDNIRSGFQRIFKGPEINHWSQLERSTYQNPGPSSSTHEEVFFQVNIGEEFANKLEEKFGDPSLKLPEGFQPVIEIPVNLGRQLYAAYIESIFRQQEAHNQIINQLIKEDEEFARRLQEEYEESEGATASKASLEKHQPDYFGSRNEAVSLPDVPNFQGVSNEEALHLFAQSKPQQFQFTEQILKPHSLTTDFKEDKENIDAVDATGFPHPAAYYREQAQDHLKKRQQLYQLAQHYLKLNNKKSANCYFKQAQEERNLYEQANNFAAAAFLIENKERNPSRNTIDLHHLFVKEAIQALDIFLDEEIRTLQSESIETKSLMVITGRGKHSPHGIPKIKPAVIERLGERSLRYSELNPGLLKVRISRYSYLTHELED